MIVKQSVIEFEKLGLGLYLHLGLYSLLEQGEWTLFSNQIDTECYEALAKEFAPQIGWARKIATFAKGIGCKYMTITTRHHDGFSLYDTRGLNTYDAPHFCKRDLIREFVDACREYGLQPFFYHTLLDWREPTFEADFPAYQKYLRSSIQLLCTNYGKIGGFLLDGQWSKPEADWEEDALYAMIRNHQPDCIIINNTGLEALGKTGHIELDSVTYERGKPHRLPEDAPKYLAGEVSESVCSHWGCATQDMNYKSPADLIRILAGCRRFGANFLLNVGPLADGSLQPIDIAILEKLGKWVGIYEEALRNPRPTYIDIANNPDDFLLKDGKNYYLFCDHLPTDADPNVAATKIFDGYSDEFLLPETIQSITWLDNGESVSFTQTGSAVTVHTTPFVYGRNTVIRVAKIICK